MYVTNNIKNLVICISNHRTLHFIQSSILKKEDSLRQDINSQYQQLINFMLYIIANFQFCFNRNPAQQRVLYD
jgi:hypothetical protein